MWNVAYIKESEILEVSISFSGVQGRGGEWGVQGREGGV